MSLCPKDFDKDTPAYLLDMHGKWQNCENWTLEKVNISSIGKKYVYVNIQYTEIPFEQLNSNNYLTQKSTYSSDKLLFINQADAENYLEREKLKKWFYKEFSAYNSFDKYSLMQLKNAKKALEQS